jgi:hypothetical protein
MTIYKNMFRLHTRHWRQVVNCYYDRSTKIGCNKRSKWIKFIYTQVKMYVLWFHWKLRMHLIKLFPNFTIRKVNHDSEFHHWKGASWLHSSYHVMCSTIFRDIDNFYIIEMIGKYLSFLYETSFFLLQLLGLYGVC